MKFTFSILILLSLQNLFSQTPSVCTDANMDNVCDFSSFIHIDQFGYFPEGEKVAVLSDPQTGFNAADSYSPGAILEIREVSTDTIAFSGTATHWNSGAEHTESGDKGWWFDFSSVSEEGTYFVYDPTNHLRSPNFEIAPNIYDEVLKASLKMYFYNRCNAVKAAPFADSKWTDAMSFLNPLQDANCRYVNDPSNAALEKDLRGGWFDAGDYNKYITFAGPVVHDLLWAYLENPSVFGDDWNIPESGNCLPDLLDEVKYELDWMLRMTNSDGSVHIKMGSTSHSLNAGNPPSVNTAPRVYGPTCTSASIVNAGVFAHAALVFGQFPEMAAFAQTLEDKAEDCWNYALPFLNSNTLETNCDDLSIVSGDADRSAAEQKEGAVASAIHLFSQTGKATYNTYISANINDANPIAIDYWDGQNMWVKDALLHYTTLSGANSTTKTTILDSATPNLTWNYNGAMGFDADDLYRAEMPTYQYHWGSNRPKAATAVLNLLAIKYNINPGGASNYERKANEQIHYFHGVNPLGIVYLSNMYEFGGDHCANEIYHTWFADGSIYDHALNSTNGPAPGYMAGGPNENFSVTSISPPAGQPKQKSYLDFNTGWPDSSWEITEPSITYQSIYVRLLANFGSKNVCNTVCGKLPMQVLKK